MCNRNVDEPHDAQRARLISKCCLCISFIAVWMRSCFRLWLSPDFCFRFCVSEKEMFKKKKKKNPKILSHASLLF